MSKQLPSLINQIQQCQVCSAHLPFPPKPVIQVSANAQVLIIGQAPGLKVQETGIPWNDASGKRLRQWLHMDEASFYNPDKLAIMPMGFCYPGKGKSGDLPPRKECAATWHDAILDELKNLRLILLIGQYAQNHYLKGSEFLQQYKTLTQRVRHTQGLNDGSNKLNLKPPINNTDIICLPHPSPRNQIWLKKHPWFETDTLPYLKTKLDALKY